LFKTLRVLAAFFYVAVFALVMPSSPASAAIAEQPCNQYSWTGEDDNAHQMSLPYNLPLGDTTYSTTYVTTNGTLTFGTPDATFHTYPSTPSISLAGYDWVTFGEGTSLSYGVTSTGFCVEWKVRPFPQSSGDITTIKLTVDTSRLPTWSGIVETTGWLPADLRRGIRFQSGEEVVQISEAFTINGGRPVEMQTCWDGTIIPMSGTCPAEPPPGQCWDGSTVAYNETCPPIPPDTQCWDGTWVAWSQTCAPEPQPITCWDGSVIPYNQTCPPTPPDIVCWDNSTVAWNGTCLPEPPPIECWDGTSVPWNQSCSPEPQILCWDNSIVHFESECDPTPPDIVCWNGDVISWNQTCPQMPPPIECWDGSQVNWNEQCPTELPLTITYPDDAIFITIDEGGQLNYVAPVGMKINQILFASYGTPNEYQYGLCHAENSVTLVSNAVISNALVISADNRVFGDPCGGTGKYLSVVFTIEVDPTYVAPTPTPSPGPTQSQSPEPTPEPTPTPIEPTPEPTEPTPTPTEPSLTPEPTPTPTPSETPDLPTPEEPLSTIAPEDLEPSPEPTPEPTIEPEPIIEPIEEVVDNASEDGVITEEETQAVIDNLLSDGDLSTSEVADLLDNLQSDGTLSQEEKELISDVLVAAYEDTAIPSDVFEASGLDYEDLPPEQPITLENGVVITAEIADAIEIFKNPSELLATVFTDPSKALKAIANVGADMTAETRKDAQEVTVAAVIVTQVIAGTSALTLARK
jgi:hypothetical protein